MKILSYGFFGLIVGATLGAILGSGQLFQAHITKQEMKADFDSWKWTILGAIGGAVIMGTMGAKVDRVERLGSEESQIEKERVNEIKKALGLAPYPPVEIFQEGRHWVGVSKWIDPRHGKEYLLKTYQNEEGRLVTTLGNLTYIHNSISSAGEEAVTAAHRSSRVQVFKTLLRAYEKNSSVTVEEIFLLLNS